MADPSAWGVLTRYQDVTGAWRQPPPSTIAAVLDTMGAEAALTPPDGAVRVVQAGGAPLELPGRWDLRTEDGDVRVVSGPLVDPPLGYHRLQDQADGRVVRLIVSPGRCHLPEGLRLWGWAVQLYGLRSGSSWGMGDLGDLRRLGEWSARQGAGTLLLNPLHAAAPVLPQQASPYFSTSRSFRNPLYLRVEEVPGAAGLGPALDAAAAAGRALNSDRVVDRDAVFRLKYDALSAIWDAGVGDPDFDRYATAGGSALVRFATYCALAEELGSSWRRWPAGLRDPDSSEVDAFAEANRSRIGFHQWLQWLVDRQLAAAGATIDLMQDFAIGTDPDGADAWIWQGCIAEGMSVGAPSDEFNTLGQDWGLHPYDPWKLQAAGFEPFIQSVRAGFGHAGGLRFDHVMGLFRLFWIPHGRPASEGTYVRYPARELLDILALESHRARAYVVGEDLGTVEDEVRDELTRRDVLSYRLLWFEPTPPRTFPRRALAAVTTHDLPTVAGVWTGADVAAQRERCMEPNLDAAESLRTRLRDWTGFDEGASVPAVVKRTYELLAEAPSAIVTASLDDALEVEERPNYPGTVGGTNWTLALPVPLEEIETHDGVAAVAEALDGRQG